MSYPVVNILVYTVIVMICYTSTQCAEIIVISGECQKCQSGCEGYAECLTSNTRNYSYCSLMSQRYQKCCTQPHKMKHSNDTGESAGIILLHQQIWQLFHAHSTHPYHLALVQGLILSEQE